LAEVGEAAALAHSPEKYVPFAKLSLSTARNLDPVI
jgi:hypothetical protein